MMTSLQVVCVFIASVVNAKGGSGGGSDSAGGGIALYFDDKNWRMDRTNEDFAEWTADIDTNTEIGVVIAGIIAYLFVIWLVSYIYGRF